VLFLACPLGARKSSLGPDFLGQIGIGGWLLAMGVVDLFVVGAAKLNKLGSCDSFRIKCPWARAHAKCWYIASASFFSTDF
jgi:hypothetical protein